MKIGKYVYRGVILATVLTVLSLIAFGDDKMDSMKKFKLECTECHLCTVPTPENPCLKPCPRLFEAQATGPHKSAEAPDSMLIGGLADQYQPVHFKHKLHAQMSEMNLGCQSCHHFSPPGKIPPCSACHGGEANPTNLRQPSLKGAYHRQCLSCHREWSHDTDCYVCHLATGDQLTLNANHDSTDIMGKSHPVLTTPVKKSYLTPYEKGPVVTFYHKEHIDLFGLKCVDCHQQENCAYCHDMKKPVADNKTMEQVHAICNDCHSSNNCVKCHDTKERPAFSHASTGWSIGRFHSHLDCRACHPTGKKISKVERECTSCHAGWNTGTFRHAVTGLQLDETHIGLECSDCHIDRKFNLQPSCANCHDDNRTAKSNPPGKFLKL